MKFADVQNQEWKRELQFKSPDVMRNPRGWKAEEVEPMVFAEVGKRAFNPSHRWVPDHKTKPFLDVAWGWLAGWSGSGLQNVFLCFSVIQSQTWNTWLHDSGLGGCLLKLCLACLIIKRELADSPDQVSSESSHMQPASAGISSKFTKSDQHCKLWLDYWAM